MITVADKTKCCGCSACVNICPKTCIRMKADDEGFAYPEVNTDLCINCGLCEKVCPIINNNPGNEVKTVYAAGHKSAKIKTLSSSGGMFSLLAEHILNQGGAVFGAGFDGSWRVRHTCAENANDLDNLRRSKYVQSDIGDSFKTAKDFLQKGRQVLFTGTPCQIAGLKNYLGKDYPNLLTADIICHGVPSPAVWERFLAETAPASNISAVDFRHKRFGWDASYLNITLKNGVNLPQAGGVFNYCKGFLNRSKGKLFRLIYRLPYTISNMYERPSCHACAFKGKRKYADFTMADLWGVKEVMPDMYDEKGVSLLMVNSAKADAAFKDLAVNLLYKDISLEAASKYNPYFLRSTSPSPCREEFFKSFRKGESFYKIMSRYKRRGVKGLLLKLLRLAGGAKIL